MAELDDDDDADDADMAMRLGFKATIVNFMPTVLANLVLWEQ